jgi:hypothetical protein
VTDPDDIFFMFNSIDITPDRFHKMTAFIQPLELDQVNPSKGISKSWGLNATKEVGFHDPSGKRGVTGVIANDYMNGVMKNPERYCAKFCIRFDEPQDALKLMKEEHEPPMKSAKLVFTEYVLHQHKSTLHIDFFPVTLRG